MVSRFFTGSKSEETAQVSRKPVTEARVRQLYQRPESFTDLLPWLEYDLDSQQFLLDDGHSVGALFELRAIPSESRPQEYLADLRDKLQLVISDVIPEEAINPWVLQFYLQADPSLNSLIDDLPEYVQPNARGSMLTRDWLAGVNQHLKDVARPGGLFFDQAVTGGTWSGRRIRIRVALTRRRSQKMKTPQRGDLPPELELEEVCERFTMSLSTAGLSARRLSGRDLYEWLFLWFNPNPPETGGDRYALLKQAPYPNDDPALFNRDFSELLMLAMPKSDADEGLWWFDGRPHRAVSVQTFRRIPSIGLISGEQKRGDHIFSMFDRAPEHTIAVLTITVQAQDQIRQHLNRIQKAAVGDYPEAKLAGQDAEIALMEIAKGNKLLPVQLTFYLAGDDAADLGKKTNALNSLLLANNMQPIREQDDLFPLDTYIRNLPMAYDHRFDQKRSHRSRLMFSKQIASLAPVYGRETGTGHPGLMFFNRGGEPLLFDPLNRADRKKNAHGLIIGPTGSGKSATLTYFILHMLAMHRPRIFIIEAGNSFGLLADYLAGQEVSVNKVSLQPGADVSLPPFIDALKLLDTKRPLNLELASEVDADDDPYNDYDDDPNDDTRDLLGEMEIAARIMITGGDEREDARMSRADRLLIRKAILQAAAVVKAADRDHVLTEDVVHAMSRLDGLESRRLQRAKDMADAMELFTTGLAGHFFNRPGSRWPEADVTLVDMGILAREGYEDQLTVAYIGLMNHIHDLVERNQNSDRPTLVITDEGHIITTNPLLAPYVIKIVKMWRKFGAWFWIATQNLEDFPDASRKMLNMLEWWLCLVTPKDEVEQIARFRSLTDEETALLLSSRKSPGLYTEGVVLSDQLKALFRIVPPPLALALAMTEKDEKARRRKLMKRHGVDELGAVRLMAEAIAKRRDGQV